MRKFVASAAIIAAVMAFSSSPNAQSVGEKTGVNSLVGVAPSTQDFVTQAVISDIFEIESSKLAVERASGETKKFAEKMITDHKKTSDELKKLIQSDKVKADVPTALDSAHQSKLDKLKLMNGDDFIGQYHDDQVAGHKNAVDLFKRYSGEGENAALKSWASRTKPHLDEHLKMAQDLDNKK